MPTVNIKGFSHKKSSVIENGLPKLPTAAQLELGELAINFADGYETLSIKNSNNEIVTFTNDQYWKDKEQVIASALNDLNSRILAITVPTNVSDLVNDVPYLTASDLDDTPTEDSDNGVTSGGVYDYITEIEEATSAALNDLNERIDDIPSQVQADWNQTTTTADDYIKNKPDIVQSNSPFKQITISGWTNNIVVGDSISIGRNKSKIEIGSNGSDNDTIRLTTSGSDGGVYVSTDTQKFYYNNKEVATKNDIPTTSTTVTQNDPNPVSGGAVYDVIVENEQITSAALNDLNERIDDIPELPENIVTGASTAYTIWCGTQAEYNALQTYDNNTVYLIKETV